MKKYFKIFILILVLAFTCVLTGCKTPVNDVGDTINDLIVEKGEERGIHLTKRNTKNDDGSYTITATVTPSDATNKKLLWSLEWSNSELSNSLCSQFVQIKISQDTLSCNVSLIKQFDTVINLVVKSVKNPEIFSYCTIDCYGRVETIDGFTAFFNGEDLNYMNQVDVLGSTYDYIDLTQFSYDEIFNISNPCLTISNFISSVIGTKYTDVIVDFYYNFDYSLSDKCIEYGYEELFDFGDQDKSFYIADEFTLDILDYYGFVYCPNENKLYCDLLSLFSSSSGFYQEGMQSYYYDVLGSCDYWYCLTIAVKVMNNDEVVDTYNRYIKLKFDVEFPVVDVTEVELDKASIVF